MFEYPPFFTMDGVARHSFVSTSGPHALSRIRRVLLSVLSVVGWLSRWGREDAVKEIRCRASRMLHPPVLWLYVFAISPMKVALGKRVWC